MKRTFTKWLACLALGLGAGSVQAQYVQELPSTYPDQSQLQLIGGADNAELGSGEVQVPNTPETTIEGSTDTPVVSSQVMTTPAFPMQAIYPEPMTGAGSPCCPEASGTGLCAGVGFYYVQPFFNNNPAYTFTTSRTVTNGGNSTTITNARTVDFDYDYDLAPRIFLGYVGDSGLGGKISWWRFDQSAQAQFTNTYIAPGAGFPPNSNTLFSAYGMIFSSTLGFPATAQDTMVFDSDVELDVWDFDITQQFDVQRWVLTLGGGIRYLHLSQDYNAYFSRVDTALPNNTFTQAERASNTFNVAGPNICFEGIRQLGESGFSVYGNARAGVLFGTERQALYYLSNSNMGGVTTITYTDNIGQRDAVLPFIEGELGVGWTGGAGAIQPTARCGLVGQNLFNVGSGGANTGNGNLGFFGLNFLVGANF